MAVLCAVFIIALYVDFSLFNVMLEPDIRNGLPGVSNQPMIQAGLYIADL